MVINTTNVTTEICFSNGNKHDQCHDCELFFQKVINTTNVTTVIRFSNGIKHYRYNYVSIAMPKSLFQNAINMYKIMPRGIQKGN